ncbi:MAG: prohibitin family protein [Myxococcota bacterium]
MRSWLVFCALLALGCTTIRPGEVAVKRSFGKLAEEARGPGLATYGPIGTTYVKVPVRTTNLRVKLDLPSREGLNVNAVVSVLYRVDPTKVPQLLQEVGIDYEQQLVLPVFRSAAADIAARNAAKDMHSGERSGIEDEIRLRMDKALAPKGLIVEQVLLKTITLPPGLYAAVEAKLAAEQEAQRMEFVLTREKQEAERRRIEAMGIRDSQRILEEGLSPQILAWRSLETFQELAKSNNAKVIITDGQTPMLLNPDSEAMRPAK